MRVCIPGSFSLSVFVDHILLAVMFRKLSFIIRKKLSKYGDGVLFDQMPRGGFALFWTAKSE
jgi:hypothetical protein